ncbi:hypothetical protein VIGAN_02286200 [Vigna angularis var. angularis]|uniref:Uncharacterized protein n=1 Tax=Vigna angularis var. angularis TaxID=157739 RepID=A0A0S3RHE1_PHAAN|nr:hypothetical protein VIGAN_02286200 [Vigna angularis var. angularis]
MQRGNPLLSMLTNCHGQHWTLQHSNCGHWYHQHFALAAGFCFLENTYMLLPKTSLSKQILPSKKLSLYT